MSSIDLIVAALGVSLGSFINACAYRIPRGISVVSPRSFCPGCRTTLRWHEIIPVIGFLINRGQCRNCGARISLVDPLVELLVAGLAIILFLEHGASLDFISSLSFTLVMVLIAVIDWQHLIIPNKIVATGVALFVILQIVKWQPDPIIDSLIACAAAGLVMLTILLLGNWVFKRETMGGGDVKLAALIGLYLGLEGFLASLWLATLSGAIFGSLRILVLRQPPDSRLPFGSFLAGASILYLIFRQQIQEWVQLWLTFSLS